MGVYDEYLPQPEPQCPKCGAIMRGWQGGDGPCAFLVWKQGEVEPIDQPIDEDAKLPADRIRAFRLPRRFLIYGGDCQCSSAYAALCETDESGRWTTTRLITTDEVRTFYNPNWKT